MAVQLIGRSNSPAFMAIVGRPAWVSQGCQVFRLAREVLPPLKRIVISLRGSTSKARAMVMNSTTSSLRSPPSYLATKDCGFFRRRARHTGQPCCPARANHWLAKGGLVGRMEEFADTAGG
jgi:hypothetical protein